MSEKEVKCLLCQGTKEVIRRPARLMGATYLETDQYKGDEHFEPCPLCCSEEEAGSKPVKHSR